MPRLMAIIVMIFMAGGFGIWGEIKVTDSVISGNIAGNKVGGFSLWSGQGVYVTRGNSCYKQPDFTIVQNMAQVSV